MDSADVWRHIDSERAWMADLLESLSTDDWQRPSLCSGWTVRDVGAHLTFAHTPVRELLWPALRAGFRYDVVVRDTAIRSPLTHEEIVAMLRSFLGSRRRVSFITDLEPLIDILVHNQDVARPLGIEHPIPPDAAAAAADRVLATPAPIRLWKPPPGVRLMATDTDWAFGSGREVHAPMGTHLLTLTGRLPVPRGRPGTA
ncbi:maleylpyruvate isomerase family mycothiol-dependent enzyme [Nocardioides sp. zg-1308]|uniref:maleylpyruvate isomerase family mycothiol-dependent enzyme n=1 Tax=Nocardioides sp. zg-1308 TaxID=2736253 RepID=UPI001551D3B8|nr:maleylpyruvate isomerase family mycothiol-dependent enzyme [Nocardioides sp. zg-1308]NPD06087.1 maleylpyruvate isomerase family mycothiol-dependent enzyme [Nocardioides sp. zg-1308]